MNEKKTTWGRGWGVVIPFCMQRKQGIHAMNVLLYIIPRMYLMALQPPADVEGGTDSSSSCWIEGGEEWPAAVSPVIRSPFSLPPP